MNYARNTEIIKKDSHDHQRKFVYCYDFNHSFAQNMIIFIQGTSVENPKNFSRTSPPRPVRTIPWITQGLRGLELKYYNELLRFVNRDSLKGNTSYDTFSPRAIWDKILPTTGAILNP